MEIPLYTYHRFQDPTLATQAVRERMLYGLASRQQRHADAAFEAGMEQPGPSKSSVSCRFIQATQQALDHFLQLRLDDRTWVMMIDGLREGDQMVVSALGIDADDHQRVLGLVEAATENHRVVLALLQDLITRGLTAAHGLLVVIDGAKALAKAVLQVWGDQVLIPRCQIDKQRNVLVHLPKSTENRVRQRLRKESRTGLRNAREGAGTGPCRRRRKPSGRTRGNLNRASFGSSGPLTPNVGEHRCHGIPQ